MALQFLSDSNGNPKAVVIPIANWNLITKQHNDVKALTELDLEESYEIPEWHKELVRERIASAKPQDYISWDEVQKQINMK